MNNNAVIAVAVAALLVAGGGAAAYFMMNDGGKGSDDPELIVGQYTYDAYDHASGKNVKMPAFYEDSYFDKGASADNPSLMMFAFNIAMSCGYSHMAHFSKMFKQETGLTPQEYRTKYRK